MSLRSRASTQIDYEDWIAPTEYPVLGIWQEEPSVKLPNGASPDMSNCTVYDGKLRKRYGYGPFDDDDPADSAIVGLISMQDDEDNTHLLRIWTDGVQWFDFADDTWKDATGPALTGGATQWHSVEISQGLVVFSQGLDQVMAYDVSSNTYAILDADCPAARYLTRFTDRLVLGFTVESGDTKPFRIRRSIAGDHTDWVGVGSGFTDLSEYPHRIRALRKTAAQMAIYTEESIQLATRTGQFTAPYEINPIDTGVGLFADRAITDLPGNKHMFLGDGSVNVFDGVQAVEVPHTALHAMFGELSPSNVRHYFAATLKERSEVALFVTTNSASSIYPNRVWVYNYKRKIWYVWDIPGALPHVCCNHRQDDTLTIDDLVGTIDEQNWEFDSRFIQAAFRAFLTGHDDGKVYQWGAQYGSDNGSVINSYWTSRDFEIDDLGEGYPDTDLTLRHLVITGTDTGACDLEIFFSTDGGYTWDGPHNVSFTDGKPGAEITKVVTRQVTGNKVRWKVVHARVNQTFIISQFRPCFEKRAQTTV
jgi:hypothetical protein